MRLRIGLLAGKPQQPMTGADPTSTDRHGGEVDQRPAIYDRIGTTYRRTRQPDPRIAAAIHSALGSGENLLNVGAGTGNYEPHDRPVIAVEPSETMIRQRIGDVPVLRAVAEHLPFPDVTFHAAMALLTIHHWSDPAAGLRELRRVSHRQIVWFCEPLSVHNFWPLEYFPAATSLAVVQDPPGETVLRANLDVSEIRTVLIPRDCRDGFGAAYWARPDAYLDPEVAAGMSWLAMLTPEARQAGTRRLAADLASGAWHRRHGHLQSRNSFDGGLRIAIAA
ncbi:MAG: class I SAM-dependent methyltransferase [Actinomycetota bacterium]|nr:class I SAM-dependent methyltransferase [Actinomycetota bacterium]